MNKVILFVDDDADDTELFCEALMEVDNDLTCYFATDGQRALDKLEKHISHLPDLAFLDINMPGMNGWECLSRIKASDAYKHMPVIIYSTSSHSRDIDKARSLGALCFFNKPNNYRELIAKLGIIVSHLNQEKLADLGFDNKAGIIFY